MGSSNRHWPSMFKSKPTCNTTHHHHHHHHQWHANDSNNLISSPCHRSPYSSGYEERSLDPKPRWNPKPEQIRILESIFNSGMVNPPRDEIRKIRTLLQQYGQVGDANVFYWFQNRKSRSKHKNRHIHKSQKQQSYSNLLPSPLPATSSSEKSSTGSVNQTYFGNEEFGTHEPNFYLNTSTTSDVGRCFSDNQDQIVGSGSKGMLLTDLIMMNQQTGKEKRIKFSNRYSFTAPSPTPTISTVHSSNPTIHTTVPPTNIDIQGVEDEGAAKSIVFINDVAYEVATAPLNVKEAFGENAVLIHSYGHPVVTNESGVTLQSLQHGAFYYLEIIAAREILT